MCHLLVSYAASGETRDARHAGTVHATADATTSDSATLTSVIGSPLRTPYSIASRNLPRTADAPIPTTIAISASPPVPVAAPSETLHQR